MRIGVEEEECLKSCIKPGVVADVWHVELEGTENSKAGDGFLPNKAYHDPVLEYLIIG